jgi:hypothetical protein
LLYPKGERGLFLARFSTDGVVRWGQIFGGAGSVSWGVSLDVEPTSENVVVAGFFEDVVDFGGELLPSAGHVDVFVARFDEDGSHLGSRVFGGPGADGALALALDPSGDVFLGGVYAGSIDLGGGTFTTSSTLDTNGRASRPESGPHATDPGRVDPWHARNDEAQDPQGIGLVSPVPLRRARRRIDRGPRRRRVFARGA